MIRDKTSDVEVLTTLGADSLKMGIDPDGMADIADLLTNMYSDEELAVLREYSTNARDSHIMRGHGQGYNPERPIEITLPCSPYELPTADRGRYLKIKDYGVGLSVDEIESIYSLYGKSTKNTTNEQNGMMGIGGKSGLVATFGSFKLTAVKDGRKTTVMVGRNEDTEPVMNLVSVLDTDESNGVEIELPTQKYNSLRRKADALFQFGHEYGWPKGSVLVDGIEPKRIEPKIEISPTMWIVDGLYSKNQRTDFVVMGGVPYACQLDGKLSDGHSLVIFVPVGAVNFTPSREALRMTPKTKDELARLMAEYDQAVKTTIQNKVNQAKTKAEAVKIALMWKSAFATKADLDLTYKGKKMPMRFDVPALMTSNGVKEGILVTEHESEKLSKHSRQSQIYIGTLTDAVLVHGYVAGRFPPVHKKKLEAWARAKGLKPKHYVLTANRLASGWIDSSMRVDWEIVNAIKINTVKDRHGENRPKGSYPMWLAGVYSNGTAAADIPLDKPIFWMGSDYFSHSSRGRRKDRRVVVTEAYPTATFVVLTQNRVAKFKRDFPQARHASAVLDEILEAFKKTVKASDLKRLTVDEYKYNDSAAMLSELDITRINDPKIRSAIRFIKRPVNEDLRKRLAEIRNVCAHLIDKDLAVKWDDPLKAYPLASRYYLEHTYTYMNAVYAQEKSRKS